MKDLTTLLLSAFAFGALVALGMKAIEWLIPKPPVQILVCLQNDDETLGNCQKIDQLINQGARK